MMGTISMGAVVGATILRRAVSGAAKMGAGQNLRGRLPFLGLDGERKKPP